MQGAKKKEIQDDLDVRNRCGLILQELEKEKELYDKDEDREWGQYNNWDWVDSFINEMQSLLEKE